MSKAKIRIGIVAPASPLTRELAGQVSALAADRYSGDVELVFHQQCFLNSNHFAGSDDDRSAAFVDYANEETLDAIWFARGGYGACRFPEDTFSMLGEAARVKTYLGYSDMGILLGRLYKEGIGRPVHGPMPGDLARDGGEAAVIRALDFMVRGEASGLEPSVKDAPAAAFNLTVLSHIIGTPFQPDLTGHVLMLEEVSEYLYRIDRAFFTVSSNVEIRKVAGIMLGRCSDIPENDRPFGQTAEEIAADWCWRAGITYLGRADIGHDVDNKIVPFGLASEA